MARELDQDELIDRWTLVGDELNLVAGKRGATKLGFALLLRFYSERGRFPRGRGEIPDAAVDYVARQVAVGATEIAFYEWSGRTIEFHRAQIRKALGFREGSVADAEALAEWLVTNVTQSERSGERVREQLMARCRDERIEPPTSGRIDRIRLDTYAVGAEKDHIVPWDAGWRITQLFGGDVRFVLASSGHVAGIINPPGGKGNYWTRENRDAEAGSPEQWLQSATKHEGSWWPDWSAWLSARSGEKGKPPSLGSKKHPPIEEAPGTYVLEK